YADVFARCAAAGNKRVILYGAGELAEIAMLAAEGAGVELLSVFDPTTNQPRVAGLPVVRDFEDVGPDDVVVITEGRKPQESYDGLVAVLGHRRVFAPPILRISPRPATGGETA
ncbi:MAG TPA: hypothetical protein VFC38_07420, partial [Stellaceae bacterium]|nr:hypothetical protein [Stellaceae bacterium]